MNFAWKAQEYAAALEGDLDHPPINYLENRLITYYIRRDFGVGFADWGEGGQFISLPHHDAVGNVTGIRLRYIGTDPSWSRYISHKGSFMALFGVAQLRGRSTLIITEGEFNAMAVAAVRGKIGYDVLSIGSESTIPDDLKDIAASYKRVILMVDKQRCADRLLAKLGHPSVGVWLSPEVDGKELDANALLIKYGADDLTDIICMQMYGLQSVPFPQNQVDCAAIKHVCSLGWVAAALTSFRIPGKLFEQMRVLRQIEARSLDGVAIHHVLCSLISELLLYEDPDCRDALRQEICSNLSIDSGAIILPEPIRSSMLV